MAVRPYVVYDYADVGAATGGTMNGFLKNRLVVAGATLLVLGVLAIAIPVITTQDSKELITLGETKLVVKEETSYVVPPYVGWAGIAFGIALITIGVIRKRPA